MGDKSGEVAGHSRKSPPGTLPLMHHGIVCFLCLMSCGIVLLQLPLLCPPASLLKQPLAFWDEVPAKHDCTLVSQLLYTLAVSWG